MRVIKQLCVPYEELATAFSTRSVEDLSKVVEAHTEVFLQVWQSFISLTILA